MPLPWLGAWRDRLAVRASVACLHAADRFEDEAEVRDGYHLRGGADDLGPAGQMYLFWRRLWEYSPAVDDAALVEIFERHGFAWPEDVAVVWRDHLRPGREESPVTLAVLIATRLPPLPRAQAPLAFWLADLALAHRARWPHAIPLLAAAPGLRGRLIPGTDIGLPEWRRRLYVAYARAAAAAYNLAAEMERRAAILQAAVPKLRARGAPGLVAAVFANDAIPAGLPLPGISDRGQRRLLERLVILKAVREMTGRSSFRLYGL